MCNARPVFLVLKFWEESAHYTQVNKKFTFKIPANNKFNFSLETISSVFQG